MTVSPAQVVFQLFVDLGLIKKPQDATKADWAGTWNYLPEDDSRDNWVVVFNTGGVKQGRLMGTGQEVIKPTVQLRVRSADAAGGWKKITELSTVLSQAAGQTVSVSDGVTTQLVKIKNASVTSPPVSIGRAENQRRENHTANYMLTLEDA